MRMANCHPERQHWAKNLCQFCYNESYRKRPERINKTRISQRKWRKDNPEEAKVNDEKQKLRRKYNMTLDQYLQMLNLQNGVCALCESPEIAKQKGKRPNKLAVDHDHQTGRIRGLLCMNCNIAIAQIEKKPNILNKLSDYFRGNDGAKKI